MLQRYEDKIKNSSSSAHIVHTTGKQGTQVSSTTTAQRERKKFAYLTMKNHSLHALRVRLSFLDISQPFLFFPRREVICFAAWGDASYFYCKYRVTLSSFPCCQERRYNPLCPKKFYVISLYLPLWYSRSNIYKYVSPPSGKCCHLINTISRFII